jgi:hypothetical protein
MTILSRPLPGVKTGYALAPSADRADTAVEAARLVSDLLEAMGDRRSSYAADDTGLEDAAEARERDAAAALVDFILAATNERAWSEPGLRADDPAAFDRAEWPTAAVRVGEEVWGVVQHPGRDDPTPRLYRFPLAGMLAFNCH